MRRERHEQVDDGWLQALAPSSEMAAAVAAFDWSSTPLGPPETWSTSLRAVVRICLTTRFPMLVTWGPELTKIYNDGYRPMLGREKHPGALGAPVAEVWSEVWDTLGPLFDGVLAGGPPVWYEHQRLEVRRDGFVEDCWFTYSYSPLIDDDGTIGGVLDTVTETTGHVVNERRLACLGDLAAELVSGMALTDVGIRAVRALARWTDDARWAELHLCFDGELVLVASNRRAQPAGPDEAAALKEVASSGHAALVGDGGGGGGGGVLLIGITPRLRFDDGYRSFLRLCARSVSSAMASANRRAAELGVQQQINETLQRAMLKPASDSPTVGARYVPAVGHLSVGGDWYDVIDLGDDRRALVVGDCVGHDLEAAAAMGQLRSASRAVLLEGHGPATVLEAMDRFASSIDATCTTMACAIVDLRAGTLAHASAGHPPPLLVTADGARWLEDGRGAPLDVADTPRDEATVAIVPGDLLVLYTDGLVERRGEHLDEGLERLRRATWARRDDAVQALTDGLLEELLGEDVADDVVLVVERLERPRP